MPHHKQQTTITKKYGFTLIETLVALTILTITLGALSTITLSVYRSFTFAEQRHVAGQIAREGMELVINKRDNQVYCYNRGDCADWQENFSQTYSESTVKNMIQNNIGGLRVDATETAELQPGESFDPYDENLFICKESDGRFFHCNDDTYRLEHNYNRQIIIQKINEHSVYVYSIARWGNNHSVVLETVLFRR